MLTKYAEVSAPERAVEVLDAFVVPENAGHQRLSRLRRRAHRHNFEYSPRPGYIYVRSRAISSRCNDNFDEFPAPEIKKAYRTFIGKPVFVNHHNADHRRARGVIIDAALHEDTNPDGTEDTWAEVLMEVDAVRFPVLAREVLAGNIARTSMGTDVAYSECTACGNKAATPADYCQHIPKMKGMKMRRPAYTADGKVAGTEEVLIAERCYGLAFFENSLLVEDPADPTAFGWVDSVGEGVPGISAAAAKAVINEAETVVRQTSRTARTAARTEAGFLDDVGRILRGGVDPRHQCTECGSTFRWSEAVHKFVCPEGHATRPAMATRTARTDSLRVTDLTPGEQIMWRHDEVGARSLINGEVVATDGTTVTIKGDDRTGFTAEVDDEGLATGRWTILRAAARSTVAGSICPKCNPGNHMATGQPLCNSHHRQQQWGADHFGTSTMFDADPAAFGRVSAVAALLAEEAQMSTTAVDTKSDDYAQGFGDGFRRRPRAKDTEDYKAGYDEGYAESSFDIESSRRTAGFADAFPVGARVQWVEPNFGGATTFVDFTGYGTVVDHTADRVKIRLDDGRERYARERDLTLVSRGTGASRHVHAYGETKAPAKVDTMRAENCPVCGDDEGYNGDKCSVCGYMQPPDQFTDPDLTKARENDLRQEQADASALPEEQGVEAEGDLQCDQCGEVFSAEGDAATGAEAEGDVAAEQATGDDPEDPASPTDDPTDLTDLADVDDDEIFEDPETEEKVEEKVEQEIDEKVEPEAIEDEDGDDGDEDPFADEDLADAEEEEIVDPINSTTDPAVGEGRITSEPEESTETTLDAPVAAGQVCPVCGEGTLSPVATTVTTDGKEPPLNEVGTPPTKQPTARRRG